LRVTARAPATSANVGPGFDCVGVALDLWNELEVTDEGSDESDPEHSAPEHLGVRAFGLVAPTRGLSFSFTSPIPRARGLGSSAAVIALGLVAGCRVAGREPDPEELLALGGPLEGHEDNLAACLAGGVCLTWASLTSASRIARIADRVPATPIALVPESKVETAAARASLPDTVTHGDAAFTAGRAALLGAALAAGDPELFAAALADRLHEPYRATGAPLLAALRADPPPGALGTTISGSGPTVIVWARDEDARVCAAELTARFPDARALPLAVARQGATAQ
jgi:homoserine kinase